MVTYLSILWRDRVDKIAMHAAQWSEEYMLGKKSFLDLLQAIGRYLQRPKSLTNGNSSDEKRPAKEAHPV